MLRLLDPGLGRPALFTRHAAGARMREVVGEPRIEDLPIDFTAVAVDLLRQREVWLRARRPVGRAARLVRDSRPVHAA